MTEKDNNWGDRDRVPLFPKRAVESEVIEWGEDLHDYALMLKAGVAFDTEDRSMAEQNVHEQGANRILQGIVMRALKGQRTLQKRVRMQQRADGMRDHGAYALDVLMSEFRPEVPEEQIERKSNFDKKCNVHLNPDYEPAEVAAYCEEIFSCHALLGDRDKLEPWQMAAKLRALVPVHLVEHAWQEAKAKLEEEGELDYPLSVMGAIGTTFATYRSRSRLASARVMLPRAKSAASTSSEALVPKLAAVAIASGASTESLHAGSAEADLCASCEFVDDELAELYGAQAHAVFEAGRVADAFLSTLRPLLRTCSFCGRVGHDAEPSTPTSRDGCYRKHTNEMDPEKLARMRPVIQKEMLADRALSSQGKAISKAPPRATRPTGGSGARPTTPATHTASTATCTLGELDAASLSFGSTALVHGQTLRDLSYALPAQLRSLTELAAELGEDDSEDDSRSEEEGARYALHRLDMPPPPPPTPAQREERRDERRGARRDERHETPASGNARAHRAARGLRKPSEREMRMLMGSERKATCSGRRLTTKAHLDTPTYAYHADGEASAPQLQSPRAGRERGAAGHPEVSCASARARHAALPSVREAEVYDTQSVIFTEKFEVGVGHQISGSDDTSSRSEKPACGSEVRDAVCPGAATALPCEQSEGGGDAGLHEMLGDVLRRVALVQDACELSRVYAASAAHSMQMLSLLQMQSGLCERASIGACAIAATRREAGTQCKAVQHERSTQCEGRPLTTPMAVELTPPPVAPRVADTLVVDSLHEEATIRCRLPSSTWTSPDLNAGAEMRTLQEVEEKVCAGSSGEGEARGRVETLAEVLPHNEGASARRAREVGG